MTQKLPQYTANQKTGNHSAAILKAIMQEVCIFTDLDQSQDLGIDFIGTIIQDSVPTEYNFNVQCKGSDNPDTKLNVAGTEYSYDIKVTTINYWLQKKDVTFLILVDEEKKVAYWCSPLHEIEHKDIQGQRTYTVHIPTKNCLDMEMKNLPDDFYFEIAWYYSNFAQKYITQLDKLSSMVQSSLDGKQALELMDVLLRNIKAINEKQIEVMEKMVAKIKSDLARSVSYCVQLDQMDDTVRQYCPKGIFNTPFGTDNGVKTIKECSAKVNSIISNNNITYSELFKLSKEVFELRGNLIGFLHEMVYEDMPFSDHPDVDEEFFLWLDEKKAMKSVN